MPKNLDISKFFCMGNRKYLSYYRKDLLLLLVGKISCSCVALKFDC